MKTLQVTSRQLKMAERWDLDYHLPPVDILEYPKDTVVPVSSCASMVKTKRDPTKKPEVPFLYVDISSIDVETGSLVRPQELTGSEAPSRARKVIHAYDIIVSTCRPTRGAIAVVPEELHGQICSTGFSVVRAKEGVNPFYLHFAFRLKSTLEQFRKWSTGSSYPAILDEDVEKTRIPLPKPKLQDEIAGVLRTAVRRRDIAKRAANEAWQTTSEAILKKLSTAPCQTLDKFDSDLVVYTIAQVQERLAVLGGVEEENATSEETLLDLFGEDVEDTPPE